MKKVLHISTYYPPCYGGIEQVAYDIVSGLIGKYEQRVICFNHEKNNSYGEYEGIQVTRVGYWKKISSQAISFTYFQELKKMMKEYNPEIIHVHLPNPLITVYLLMLNLKNRKLVLHWHSDIIKQKILRNFYRPFEKKILQKANEIIVATEYHLKYSDSLQPFSDKVKVFSYCLDFMKYGVTKVKNMRENRVFFLGRHVPYKGLEYLIKATDFFPADIEVIIGGQGPLTEKLKKISEEKKNIKFVGKITNEEVKEYLDTSKVFAFPSITKNEAFGVAMAEALYAGLPAVSFNINGSGVNWVNQNGETGIVVENMNYQEFGKAIDRLMCNPILWERMSQNAHKWVKEQMNKEKFIDNIISTYEEDYK